MKTTLNIEESLLIEAMQSVGVQEKTTAVRMGLEVLIERAAARRLAALGGTMRDFKVPPRQRNQSSR